MFRQNESPLVMFDRERYASQKLGLFPLAFYFSSATT
jgi:hypothetical protein